MTDSNIPELEKLYHEYEKSLLPTTKIAIGEKVMRVLSLMVIEQDAEIRKINARINQCQK